MLPLNILQFVLLLNAPLLYLHCIFLHYIGFCLFCSLNTSGLLVNVLCTLTIVFECFNVTTDFSQTLFEYSVLLFIFLLNGSIEH